MPIELVISGGQTGADQAGWRAAKAAGIPTGGWMPKGFLTEAGPRPEFAEMYGAKAHDSASYRDRTISNIGLADMTLLFGNPNTPGGRLAMSEANDIAHPVFVIRGSENPTPATTVRFIRRWTGVKALNVAGNRESKGRGIGAWVERYLSEVFRLLAERGA
jgi:hypothetical protein